MEREHPGGSELWAEAGRTSDPPEQVASGAEFPSPLPSLGDESFPFHILLRAPQRGHSSFLGPLHLQFNLLSTRTSRPEDPRIPLMPKILHLLQLHLNANLQGPLYPLTALYFITLGFFLSIAIHPSPKPFPSVCIILASLEIKSSKTPRTVHNLLSFPHPSWNILKPALHLAPLLPWRYQVGSLPASVAQSWWFVISTILPAHSSAHSLNFSTVETLQTLSLGWAQPLVSSALYTLNKAGENHPALLISSIMKTNLQPQFLQT